VGAGGGYLTLRLAEAVGATGRVVATDVDAEALRALRGRAQRLPASAASIVTQVVSPTEPGLESGGYDLILLAAVDHLLTDRRDYLRRLRPALRPGGRIAISNSERYAQAAQRDAVAAGFQVERSDVVLPAQFLLLLRPSGPEPKDPDAARRGN
jgi:predicted O-methyltransferase YrrM